MMNYRENFTKPSLVEPGVKYFLRETLKQCNSVVSSEALNSCQETKQGKYAKTSVHITE